MQITATEAKNRLGYYLSQAEREPVRALKNGRVAAVIVSAAWFAEQNAHHQAHGPWCDGLVSTASAWPT